MILPILMALGALGVAPLTPNPALTPGVTDPRVTQANIQTTICKPGYTATVRHVTAGTKAIVFAEYGINPKVGGPYEVDHLISLEIGGSNDVHNLWSQSYTTKPWNAHVKDDLENRLHALVCTGKITLKDAQTAISTDWRSAYVKYVGPQP